MLFFFSHVLTIVVFNVIETAKVQPSVDKVKRNFNREVTTIEVNIFECVAGRDTNLTTKICRRVASKCYDIRGFRIIVELFVQFGVDVCGEEYDGKFTCGVF